MTTVTYSTMEKLARLEGGHLEGTAVTSAEPWDDSQPPLFLTHPLDLTLTENTLAHIECRVVPVGDPSLKIEWFHNGKPLTAGTRIKQISDFGFVILELSGVYQRDTGLYICKASNRHGETTTSCKITVVSRHGIVLEPQLPKAATEDSLEQQVNGNEENPNAPKFITEIQDLPGLNEGEAAHFECRVEPVGDPDMTITWYHNSRPMELGSRIHCVNDFGFIVLDIDWTIPRDSGEYVCRAANKWGVAITKAKIVCKGKRDVTTDSQVQQVGYPSQRDDPFPVPPKFITQIKRLDLHEGESAHFDCRLEPVNDPKLKVEWFHNGKPLTAGHRFKTTHDFGYVALDILYVYPENSGEYVARAVNDLGQDITNTSLTCKASESIILYNKLPADLKHAEAVVQMEATLKKYLQEEIKLKAGDVFNPDKKQPPKFVTKIKNLIRKEGQPCKFECQLSPVGDPNMKVEWFFNGKPLSFKSRYSPVYDFGYVSLEFSWVYADDSGEYLCRATNLYGSDETRAILKSSGKPAINYESQVPKSMQGGMKKIQMLEDARLRIIEQEDLPREKCKPQFVMKLEPVVMLEGEWAKFSVRILGFPRPRVMWMLNGRTAMTGSRFKLWFDGMYHLDIPKTRQYDSGKLEVIARNSMGEAYCSTTLDVRPKLEDYRAVLKNSPRPWYDSELKNYQEERQDLEIERVFEEHLDEANCDVYHVERETGEHKITRKEKSRAELDELFRKRREQTDQYYQNLVGGENLSREERIARTKQVAEGISLVHGIAKNYEEKVISTVDSKVSITHVKSASSEGQEASTSQTGESPEQAETQASTVQQVQATAAVSLESQSVVHGKEVVTQQQVQTQKENQGDLEITRKITVTETLEQEHKGVTTERVVEGPVEKTEPPVFTKKLQPCRSNEGQSAKFECEFTGLPPPSITWYREDFPIKCSEDFTIVTTDTSSTLAMREVFVEDSGVFSVVAENRGGSAKSNANLVVEEKRERKGPIPPSFIQTIQDVQVKAGQLARMDAKVTGSKPLDVYWLKGGQKVSADIRYKLLEEDDVLTLLIIETFPEDSGMYECVAINQSGEARCQATITVEAKRKESESQLSEKSETEVQAPKVLEGLEDQTVVEGQGAGFHCRVAADPEPTVQWHRGDSLIKPSKYFQMSQEGESISLLISEAFPEDEGVYKCVISNEAGEVQLTANLKVVGSDVAIIPPSVDSLTDVTVCEGSTATFTTEVAGNPTPTVEWFREGILIPQSADFDMSQEGSRCKLLISSTFVEDSGEYTCRASNLSGQAESRAVLTVQSKPESEPEPEPEAESEPDPEPEPESEPDPELQAESES